MKEFDKTIEKARKIGKVIKYKDFVNTNEVEDSKLNEEETKYYEEICKNKKA